jgi:hypothetical protein
MKPLLRKTNLFLFAFMFASLMLHGQEMYFSTGINTTTYDFKSTDNLPLELKPKTGQFYELGYKIPVIEDRLNYGVGFAINNFNSTGGDTANNYEWQTTYLGLNNHLEYIIIPSDRSPIEVSGALQLQLMHIINGEQKINGQQFDLKEEKEFTGFWVQPGATVTAKYFMSDDWQLSLGYNYSLGINVSNNTEEKLKFNNQQIRFGIHFLIN